MSREIISKIKETEAEANRIKSSAKEEARVRVQRAEENGKKLCAKAELDSQRNNSEKLRLTKQKTDALLEGIRNDSESEAAKMRAEAEFNMREAVRFIISGVNEKCQ